MLPMMDKWFPYFAKAKKFMWEEAALKKAGHPIMRILLNYIINFAGQSADDMEERIL